MKNNYSTNFLVTHIFTPCFFAFFWLCLFFQSHFTFAQKTKPDTCKVGIYITSLYDFKIKEGSFTTIFWFWRVYQNDSLDFNEGIDIVNAKQSSFGKPLKDKKGKYTWTTQKIKTECKTAWEVSKFPFDKQIFSIKFDDSFYDASKLVMKADKKNSKIDDSVKFPDWDITKFEINDHIKTYKTTYGDPTLEGTSDYSQVTIDIHLERTGSWLTYFKLLTGLFFAFLISLSVSLVPEKFFASRMPVCVGGLFSAVGSKYVAENTVPSTTSFTLIDAIHNFTFLYILFCIISGIIAMQISIKYDVKTARRWDVRAFFYLLGSYILIVWGMTAWADLS